MLSPLINKLQKKNLPIRTEMKRRVPDESETVTEILNQLEFAAQSKSSKVFQNKYHKIRKSTAIYYVH